MKGMNMMYGYRGKVAGMVIAGAGIIALVAQKLTSFTLIDKYNSAQHFNILLFITLLGLVTMMFSKEKMEDERVQAVRTKSLMYAFLMTIVAPIAFAFTISTQPGALTDSAVLTNDDVIELARVLMFYPAAGVVLYLIMFHVGIYFDGVWDYEDKPWTPKTVLQHKRNKLLVIIVSIAVILLLFLLIR